MDILPRIKNYSLILAALILVANLVLLDLFLVKQKNELLDLQTRLTQITPLVQTQLPVASISGEPQVIISNSNSCPQSCLGIITNATKSATVVARPQSTQSLLAPITPPSVKEFFIPLGTGSLTTLNTWTDINTAQATFDTANYPSMTAAYFEAIMHTNQGEVKARLYDTTTPFIYSGEQVSTTSNTGQLVSHSIPIRSGSKTYKVQMYTTIATGTLDQARIRIVTK